MTDSTTRGTSRNRSGFSVLGLFRRPEGGALIGLLLVFVFFSYFGWDRNFLSALGAASWLNFASTVGIIAIPIAFLMIAGELDISVGAMVPAAKISVAIAADFFGLNIWLAIGITLAIAAAVGWINGILVVRTKVPSLIVTLATLFAVGGMTLFLSLYLTDTTQQALRDESTDAVAEFVFGTYHTLKLGDLTLWQGLQSSVFIWIAMAAACYYFLHVSPWGNWVFALGGDKESARNAGIPINKLKIGLFMLTAMAAAVSGISETVLSNSASTTTQFTMIFNTIIAVVVGGVLLTGGFGTVIGVFLGTATLAIVQQGINYTSFDRNLSNLIIGVMLLIAVLTNDTFRIMATNWSSAKKN
ncbi:MAG: ABC transporter permease [Rhodobacteraceae bacterium]|nr:ABC transporter permease [Paracoccaceae bacterium]MCB2119823.1 ABC transporter permease [Paracoccaceae bacterium]MCB2122374.1 ABC transporter permease [Paracoccaceae bacterium]